MSDTNKNIIVCGAFDDTRSRKIRFLQEAARLGPLHVLLWSDTLAHALTGSAPKFPLAERRYYLEAIRYIHRVHVVETVTNLDELPYVPDLAPHTWVIPERQDNRKKQSFCAARGLKYHVLADEQLAGYPDDPGKDAQPSTHKKVLVTGCYDWFHTGHVRFFEEASELGDLYVVVGHDANIRLLKGEGHPMFDERQRRYIVGSIRYVTAALISSGQGWMDAEPEVERIKPDMYAVNEDGDKPEKRAFCAEHDLEYVVLKRLPKPGLPRRESTHLRGF